MTSCGGKICSGSRGSNYLDKHEHEQKENEQEEAEEGKRKYCYRSG